MNVTALDDEKLVEIIKAHGYEADYAFSEIVNRYKNKIATYAYRFTGDVSMAEDITQETFLRVYTRCRDFNSRAKFSTWLFTITINLLKDLHKWHKRHPQKSFDWTSSETSDTTSKIPAINDEQADGPDQILQRQEDVDLLRKGLSMLSDEDRQIIILRDIEGLKYEEIAQVLGSAVGTVKSRLSRARLSFKNVWKKLRGGV